MKRDIGPAALISTMAHDTLLAMLQRHDNHVCASHSLALWQLLQGFTNQAMGIHEGRFAYGLACGSGKTLSVVAWVAAQYKLGLNLSVAISAQQIKSLDELKDGLIAEGVPEPLIGIRHTMGLKSGYWQDTGDEDRPIMLGSHSRIQRSEEMPTFCRYKGEPRDLLIWDESLISSDTTAIVVHDAVSALAYFSDAVTRPLIKDIHERFVAKVREECGLQEAGGDPSIFTLINDDELERALAELEGPKHGPLAWVNWRKAREALRQLACSMSVLQAGGGQSGLVLMSYRIVLDSALKNIAVLDASYVVSELCKADPTIRDATTAAMLEYKDYSNVLVKQTTAPSGRWQFDQRAESALALEEAIKSICEIPMDESILIVTYLPKDGVDLAHHLTRKLRDFGIEADAKLQGRIRFTTWGKHTTDNSFSGFQHVVALGVVRQSSAAVAASMAGQRDDASYRMTAKRLGEVELSLLACNIMQAMSRGRCRKVDAQGKALPMTLHLITKELGIEALLKKAMRGLQWDMLSTGRPNRTDEAARQIVEYVLSLPPNTERISKQLVFKNASIDPSKDVRADAMTKAMLALAVKAISNPADRWGIVGKSLQRRPRI